MSYLNENELVQCILSFKSNDNALRKKAEEVYHQQCHLNSRGVIETLSLCLCTSPDEGLRTLACVLLRRRFHVSSTSPSAWQSLPIESKNKLKASLIDALSREIKGHIRRKISHLIAEVSMCSHSVFIFSTFVCINSFSCHDMTLMIVRI